MSNKVLPEVSFHHVALSVSDFNKSLEFCTFNLWACAIPKNKISVFVFADNLTQLSFSDAEVL